MRQIGPAVAVFLVSVVLVSRVTPQVGIPLHLSRRQRLSRGQVILQVRGPQGCLDNAYLLSCRRKVIFVDRLCRKMADRVPLLRR